MNPETIANFAESMRGPVIGRHHPEYDDARQLYNALIEKAAAAHRQMRRHDRPMSSPASVNFGRESKLPIAIRGGGHGTPGFASVR